MSTIIAVDSEFKGLRDGKTRPICVTLHTPGMSEAFYIHPGACEKVIMTAQRVNDTIFKSPCVIFDYLNLQWRKTDKKCKNYSSYEIIIFFSFKDLEFLFANEKIYRDLILPQLSRTRRITSMHLIETDNGAFMSESISLPYLVNISDDSNNGKMRWCKVSIKVIDISAMQGSESLKTYAKNVGIVMDAKDTYTLKEKEDMEERYCENPAKFKPYALGDASDLPKIREKTVEFYNKIANLINVTTRTVKDFWGLSTGKIVASMLHEWLSSQLGLEVSYKPEKDELYKINHLAGCEGITNIGKLLRNKKLNYLAMVDGGRTVKERYHVVYHGVLVDIDMDSCYGNGLKNQTYFVGIPTIIDKPIGLKEFAKLIKKSIPGGWMARISWKNAPFKQDLLISKSEEKFTTWDWVIAGHDRDGFEFIDDNKKVYDASMALTTNSIHQALLNHDLWQVILNYASNAELNWLYENAVVESAALYLKSHKVDQVTDLMREGVQLAEDPNILIKGTKQWVSVELKPLLDILLNERGKYPKEDTSGNKITENLPMNTFLKLIINTIYGVIASEFFSVPGSCVSNTIVGNNITARPRVVAWCMAKSLHTGLSVTDGGVFDVNKVLKFKHTSLDLFERLHKDIFTKNNRHIFVELKPLFDSKLTYEEVLQLKKSGELDKKAWNHLKEVFGKIDIFKNNQFSFKTKDIYSKMTLHSKVDYRLIKPNGKKEYAIRGIPKIWSEQEQKKVIDPRVDLLFDAIEIDKPTRLDIKGEDLLSLADWHQHPDKDTLLPHDSVTKNQTFYSHTPLGLRHENIGQYKQLQREYHAAKVEANRLLTENAHNTMSHVAAKMVADVGLD